MTDIASYFPITNPTIIFFVVLLIILFAPIIMGKLRIPTSSAWCWLALPWASMASTSLNATTF